MKARWIRLGELAPDGFDAACVALAAAQSAASAPILGWARHEARFLFAVIVPRRRAPGRPSRWPAWGVAPAIAACRQLGLRAYLDGDAICLHGERFAAVGAREAGECVVVAAGIPALLPSPLVEDTLRRRLEAQHGWEFDHSWPSARERAECALI